jgi:ergothioneine biosynthesis protein EgtB
VSSPTSSAFQQDRLADLISRFSTVRRQSLALCEPLTPEDMMVQSTPEASPAKWHLAHTTWFFETFILREFSPRYAPFHPDFLWLFNSYYNSVSAQPEKKLRSTFSRPSLSAILNYRRHVDSAVESLLAAGIPQEAASRLDLGLHHEQQHQELLLTDIKHALWANPLQPAYREGSLASSAAQPLQWHEFPGGVHEIGHSGPSFCFDNELPRHKVYLEPFRLASRPVTCAEYLEFIQDGGYHRSDLWLSDGWTTVNSEHWTAPLYWSQNDMGEWMLFTLRGPIPLTELLSTPVCHISLYEADAYARWRGMRLPTEFEWELAATTAPVTGNLVESSRLHPAASSAPSNHPSQLYGDVWEWTASAYLGYPGFQPAPGAIGEYNAKFMSGQMVLRGGSCVTPASHIRATYRNFFQPATRWQFSGLRLAQNQS